MVPEIKGKARGQEEDEDDGAFILGKEESQGPGVALGLKKIGAMDVEAFLAFLVAQPLGGGLQLPEQIGPGTAILIQPIVSIVWVPYVNTIFPVMSRFHKGNIGNFNWLCRKTVIFILAVTLPVAIGGTILSDKIIFFLYKKAYGNSIGVFQILIWSIIFMVFSAFLCRVLMVLGRQKLYLAISFLGVVINIGLNFLLIPKYGYIGAGIATVVTQILLMLVYLQVVYKIFKIFEWGKILKIIVACGLMAILVCLLREGNLVLTITSSTIAYTICLLGLKVFSNEDLAMIRKNV